MAKQIEWTDELLSQHTAPYGLDKLDRDSKITITNMLISRCLKNYHLEPNISCYNYDSYCGTIAIYSQNYIIMRQLLEQKEELIKNNELNQKLQEQNQQIIDQNDILVKQNEQIIALLTKISEK